MRKTKNFNIQVPELGDVPDITQVSNAIQDLEDALAGTLEIMDASIQGSKLTLKSVARQTKRTKYYDGMSMRFLCPQTISANTLKTVVVDDLPQQVITVPFDIIADEYVDITYRGTSFTAHPVMIQKSESIDSNSNETVATSRAVKKVNDKVNELVDSKEPVFEKKSGFNKEKTDDYNGNDTNKLFTQKGANDLKREIDGKEPAFSKKSGFNLDKTDNITNDTNKLFTAKGAYNLKNEVDTKVSKTGDTMSGRLSIKSVPGVSMNINPDLGTSGFVLFSKSNEDKAYMGFSDGGAKHDRTLTIGGYAGTSLEIVNFENVSIASNNLKTSSKEVISAINEVNNKVYEIEVARADIGKLGNSESKRVQFKKVFKEIPFVILSSTIGVTGGTSGTEGARAIDVDRSGFTLDSQWESFTQGYIEYIAIVSK